MSHKPNVAIVAFCSGFFPSLLITLFAVFAVTKLFPSESGLLEFFALFFFLIPCVIALVIFLVPFFALKIFGQDLRGKGIKGFFYSVGIVGAFIGSVFGYPLFGLVGNLKIF
jgi:hypothetical protein